IMQRLTQPITPTQPGRSSPSGLDVMSVLGSARATEIEDAYPQIYNAGKWPAFGTERAKLSSEFAAVKPETWSSNLYWSWLHTLQALLEPAPEGYPSFMRGDAWRDKSL